MFHRDNEMGFFQAMGGVASGMFLSKLPKCKKLAPYLLVVTIIPLIYLMILPTQRILEVIIIVLFCSLIYFSFQVDFSQNWIRKPFIYLGELSFALYALQCVLAVIVYYGITNKSVLFVLLLTMSICANRQALSIFKKDSNPSRLQ
ncbi:MAG: hypothetical protein LBQ05_00255 [Christensenellaceae bacterium]|nr:hypothetical protein [Christensenellaceae bacterium]